MAYARFFRLLAILVLLAVLGLSGAWLATDWFPTGNDEITHLQNAANVASEIAAQPLQGLWDAWMGRYQGEERYAYWPGAAYIATAPLCWIGGLRAPLFALLPALLLILWAVGAGAHDLAARLPQAMQLGSVAEVERRMGVGKKTSVMLKDAHQAAAWRAVLLALLPTVMLLELRHYTLAPFVAALAAVATTLLVLSNGFRHRGLALAWGVTAGLGMMSDRMSMAFLIWAPLMVALLQPGERKKRLPNQAMAVALLGLIAGPFYWGWWQAWGGRIAGQEASDPGAMLSRLWELFGWVPLQGFGLVASLLMLLGLVGYLIRRPGWDAGFVTWVAALISPLPLLLLTEEGQGGLVLYTVAPLAVLAGVGWGRSKVHTSPAGTSVLAVGATLALALHAHSSGFIPVGLGPLAPMADRQGEPRDDADHSALAWLEHERGAAVLDLVQAKGMWAGHWLHYLVSTQAPELEVDWPVRRLLAAYQPGHFVEQPCDAGRLLVIHHEDPWFASSEVERPTGFVGMSEDELAGWHRALELARHCYAVDRATAAPLGARLTYLVRKDDVADLLTARAAADPDLDIEQALEPPVPEGAQTTLAPLPGGASCPVDMKPIQGGAYLLGPGDIEHPAPYWTPNRLAELEPFCMDTYEWPNQEGALPKTNVTWQEARLHCEAVGKRLCTVDEWEAACRGAEGWVYSYGPDYDPARCYTEGATHFDTRALRPIGSFPDCVSPQGIHDLNGSVSEWVDAEHPGPPFPPDPVVEEGTPCHEIMGGTMWGATYGQDCRSRHWHAVGHRQDDDGFRCCATLGWGE
jgi:hypothetical protein